MSELDIWLERLGLSKYSTVLTENEVEFSDLPDLTEDDLKELGLPVGPRRRLLKAAERLGVQPLSGEDRRDETASDLEASRSQRSTEADRRQLTVMFVDLVGSTALSGRLDPEDLRALMRRYQAVVAGAIGMSGGYLANWLGDGAIAYFGWPTAREDQAIEAVRAGLAAVEAVGAIPIDHSSDELLAARVGIATGQVVVGDLELGSTGPHGMVTGETPNLAARLESVAPPGCVVIGRTTRALVRSAFDLDFLGPQDIKGFDAPVDAWVVRAEREAESRFTVSDVHLTTFTGRSHEVGLLTDRWRQVQEGEGQVVLIAGEPGIGKSRIVQTFRERIEGERHRRILYQCSPQHVNSALHPAIRQLEHGAGISPGDAPAAKLDRLEALLREATPDIAETVPLIADLLSIPFQQRYGALQMPSQQQRIATLRALQNQLFALACNEPVLFVLEDAHWIDPTTQELIIETVPRLTDRSVLMLITHRPEWRDPFQGQGHVATLNLTRLSRSQIGSMVRDVAGQALPDAIIARIVERTDGVPLFVEELTKAMAEIGFTGGDDDVPVTLQASLMARLDRLGPTKEIAQIGAVVGREFGRGLLERLANRHGGDLTTALDRLVDAQLIFRARNDEGEVYTFKHALIQDVAYESLLRQRRQELHLDIAKALSDSEGWGSAPEVLALHFERGGDLEQALRWAEIASIGAAERSAQPEAIAHCTSALRILRMLGVTDDLGRERELSVLLRLGHAQFGALGGAAPETYETFEHAGTVAAQIHDRSSEIIASYGQYTGHMLAGRFPRAETAGQQIIEIGRKTGVAWIDFVGWRMVSGARCFQGNLAGADEAVERALAHGGDAMREIPPGFAHDPTSTLASLRTHIDWALGRRELALSRSSAAIEHAAAAGFDANSLAYALTWDIYLGAFERDADHLHKTATRLAAQAERSGGVFWTKVVEWAIGTAEVLRGNGAAGLPLITGAIDGLLATGAYQYVPFNKISHAEALYLNGDPTGALGVLEESRNVIDMTEQRMYEPEMHRMRGVVLEAVGRRDDAIAAYQQAVAVADGQGSVVWRDRAAANLAMIHQ